MISSVCLNPCIDKTARVERFIYGGMNRVTHTRLDGSGKGVNVAVTLRRLGAEAGCIGFLYNDNGQIIIDKLNECGAKNDFLWYDGTVRVNLKVLDESRQVITEVNEAGVPVTDEQLKDFERLTAMTASQSSYMVFTGSLPPGCPPSYYETLIRAASPYSRCVLDAEGEVLRLGLKAHPYIVKPNKYELETFAGRELNTLKEIKDAASAFIGMGVAIALVSMGGEGAVLLHGEDAFFASALSVSVASTVGAGDSMMAGFLNALKHGETVPEAFRASVAAAAAAVMTEGTQPLRIEDYEDLLSKVELVRI